METQAQETVYSRETGLRFTQVKFMPMAPSKHYYADFKFWMILAGEKAPKMNITIKGSNLEKCKEKVENFLTTKLKPEEFTVRSLKKS